MSGRSGGDSPSPDSDSEGDSPPSDDAESQSQGERGPDEVETNKIETDELETDNVEPNQKNESAGSLFDRYERLTLGRVVVAIAVVAVVLRVVSLGPRTAHWDEARVAYWAYFYTETGSLAYHWEEHGPFVQLTAGWLFEYLGVTDFAARLPVAIVGGLLPLAALLYREHLRRSETIALALFLAFNAVLLYYSRFMRSDLLVATFMFVGFGLLVRYYDTRKVRYLLVAGVFVGLGFASKENAIVYVLTWLGATALVVDQSLHSPASPDSGLDRVRANLDHYREILNTAVYRADYAIGFVLTFVLTSVVLFAPRGQGLDGRRYTDPDADPVTLGSVFQNPTELLALADESLGTAYSGYMDWFGESEETTLDTYLSFLFDYVMVLVEYAPLLTAFAVAGIVIERYARDHSRTLVMFMAYCGVASLIGYPAGSHIQGDSAWLSTHVIVPLAIPAAVGLSWTYRRGRELLERRSDSVNPLVVLVVVLLLVGVWAWFVPVQSVYVDDTAEDSRLVQFAQPHSDLGPLTETMTDISNEHDGTDVVFFGGLDDDGEFAAANSLIRHDVTGDFEGQWRVEPVCTDWGTTQPLNWYLAVAGADGACEDSATALEENVTAETVPMVVTAPDDETVPVEALEDAGYVEETYFLRSVGVEVVVYTHGQWYG